MKTRQISGKAGQSIRSVATAIITRVLQASVMVTEYSYWFLSVLIFFSCQKNLTQTDESTVVISQHTEPVEKSIMIDTSKYNLSNHILSLSLPGSSAYREIQDKVNRFYRAYSFKTKWMNADNPSPLYYALFDRLKNAAHNGLNPETYRVDYIEQLIDTLYRNNARASKDIIDADLLLTETFFHFAIHLREGRIADRGHGDKIWIAQNHHADDSDIAMLASVQDAHGLDYIIRQIQPANDQYDRLQKALVLYRELEKSDVGPLPVPARASIKAGNRHAAIPAIRKKLELMDIQVSTGDGNSNDNGAIDSLYYDNELVLAVKIFQQRCGLEPDGVIGGRTLTWLNQPFREKADLIALNMERIRWQPRNHGTQYIRVNIPEYKMRIYEQGKEAFEMNVIVGAVSNATPIFSDTLEYVVLSPTWTVPTRIIKEEFVPRLKKDSLYYAQRKNFTFYRKGKKIDPSTERWDSAFNVYHYSIIQQPGPDNALGLAKFIMPNNMNIYLHDTPDHKPFSHHYRALSHGCIRLDNPAAFAAWLLREEAEWSPASIMKVMTGGKSTKILLRKQYPVHLEYNTVWVDDQGNLNFREDIYGHDRRHLRRLCQVDSRAVNSIALR